MLKRNDCPLTGGQANNLKAISLLRDEVEHKLLGKSDLAWQGLFQACCLNFEEVLCRLFGSQVTLAKNLAFSLQFVKPDFHQLAQVSNHNLPPHIEALDARLQAMFSEAERLELSYQFRVVYTFDAATKGTANIEFVNPDSVKGKKSEIFWSTISLPTMYILTSRPRFAILFQRRPDRVLPPTTTPKRGCSIALDQKQI